MDISLEFFPISISRKIEDNKTKIYIFGREKNQKQYCLVDTYEPYFYLLPHDEIKQIQKSISSIEIYGVKAKRTEIVKINFGKNEKEVIKITLNTPREIHVLRKQIELLDIGICFDHDISTLKKYIFDKKINFFVSHSVIGELKEASPLMKCPMVILKSIEEIGEDIYKPDIMAINLETYNPHGKQKIPTKDPIVMISMVSKEYRKVITWKHFKTENQDIEIVSSEEELLTRTRDIIDSQKPDILVGYESDTFDLPYLKLRAAKYKINLDIGLDFSQIEQTENISDITGICHVDLFKFTKNFLKVKSPNLDSLIHELIPDNKKVKTFIDLVNMWNHADIENLCEHYLIDTEYILMILQNNLSFLLASSKFLGLPLFDLSRMNARQLVEWYLIKNAKEKNIIVPNKPNEQIIMQRISLKKAKMPSIKTTPGIYTNIITFNFEQLYPAIIAAHNICSEGLNCQDCISERIKIDEEIIWFCKTKKGFIPEVLDDLLSRMFRIIDILKNVEDEKKKKILQNRLEIIKIISNAFYLNFSHSTSRWFNKKLYEATLHFGSRYITLICDIIKEKGFEIIYCDSKRTFISQNEKSSNDVKELIDFINTSLPGIMEMQTESVYERAIFVDDKKRALLKDHKIDMIGFDFGEDFCFYAKRTQYNVLKLILQNGTITQALSFIKNTISELRNHKVAVEDLIIYRVISKNIEDYTEPHPHVEVAKEMRAKNYVIGPGSVIKYVITLGIGPIEQRAKIPSEIKKENIDSRFYIENQIIPSVEDVFSLFKISKEEILLSKSQSDLEHFQAKDI